MKRAWLYFGVMLVPAGCSAAQNFDEDGDGQISEVEASKALQALEAKKLEAGLWQISMTSPTGKKQETQICLTEKMAAKVSRDFYSLLRPHMEVAVTSITLDGDSFEIAGTDRRGAASESGSVRPDSYEFTQVLRGEKRSGSGTLSGPCP